MRILEGITELRAYCKERTAKIRPVEVVEPDPSPAMKAAREAYQKLNKRLSYRTLAPVKAALKKMVEEIDGVKNPNVWGPPEPKLTVSAGVMVVPVCNPNMHSYRVDEPVFITFPISNTPGGTSRGYQVGRVMGNYLSGDPEAVRAATDEEIDSFFDMAEAIEKIPREDRSEVQDKFIQGILGLMVLL